MRDPFLIIVDHELCQGTLAGFSLGLGQALSRLGETVEYYTFKKDNLGELDPFIGRHYSAVFGLHTTILNARLPGGNGFLSDYLYGPKFQMATDNPLGLVGLVNDVPKDYHLLASDKNYRQLVADFFPQVKSAFTFYPGGEAYDFGTDFAKRDIPLLFLGGFYNYRPNLAAVKAMNPDVRYLAYRFMHYIIKNPTGDYRKALDYALSCIGAHPDEGTYFTLLVGLKDVDRLVFYRTKELMIKCLLEEGVPVTVLGDSWYETPFADNKLLTILPEASYEECLKIYSRAKLSLNMMTTHRDAVTERVVQSMLCGAAVASSSTTGLEAAFEDDEIFLFPYGNKAVLRENAKKISSLLSDDARLSSLAEKGYKKALADHTWDARAKQFLEIVKSV